MEALRSRTCESLAENACWPNSYEFGYSESDLITICPSIKPKNFDLRPNLKLLERRLNLFESRLATSELLLKFLSNFIKVFRLTNLI